MGEHILDCGDCLELLKTVPDGSVDMVLCDLPYGTTQNKWDSVIPFAALWEQYRRVVKGNAAIVLSAQTPFDKTLGFSNILQLKYEWIWVKSKPTGHLNANRAPMKQHENILVFCLGQSLYYPQNIVEKVVPTIRKGRSGNGTNYGKSDRDAVQIFENYPRSVIHFQSESKTVHPTQKPVALWEYLILTYTNPGDTVLDNCCGSGTTGVACVNTNRSSIQFELSPNYFDIAAKRLDDAIERRLEAVGESEQVGDVEEVNTNA